MNPNTWTPEKSFAVSLGPCQFPMGQLVLASSTGHAYVKIHSLGASSASYTAGSSYRHASCGPLTLAQQKTPWALASLRTTSAQSAKQRLTMLLLHPSFPPSFPEIHEQVPEFLTVLGYGKTSGSNGVRNPLLAGLPSILGQTRTVTA